MKKFDYYLCEYWTSLIGFHKHYIRVGTSDEFAICLRGKELPMYIIRWKTPHISPPDDIPVLKLSIKMSRVAAIEGHVFHESIAHFQADNS
jgi:hypothetical protein